jgi:hypothetical protein
MIASTELHLIVEQELADYADGPLIKGVISAVANHEQQTYAVIVAPDDERLFKPNLVMMARVIDDYVVIDADKSDRPLVDELVRAGIPREQIICLYAGEQFTTEK